MIKSLRPYHGNHHLRLNKELNRQFIVMYLNNIKQYLFLMLLNIATASLGAFMISKFGHRLHLLDHPNYRSSHISPIPKAGAIGMLLSFMITSYLLKLPLHFYITVMCFSLLGLAADRFKLSSQLRLVFQFFFAGFFWTYYANFNFSLLNLALGILIIICILGTTNIYNFMDGINGIAIITGIVGFGLLAIFLYQNGKPYYFIIASLCVALSCIGFLPWNLPQAKVFMGDVGSTLLGAVFSCLAIMASSTILEFICIASFLFTFYADEIITMYLRLSNRENLLQPHCKHFYQFLSNTLKIPHWRISLGYGFIQAIIGIAVIILKPFGITTILVILCVLFISIAFSAFLIYNKTSFYKRANG